MRVEFSGNMLKLNGAEIEMEAPILRTKRFGSLILVRMDDREYGDGDPNAERNILAVDGTGAVKWRIQKTPDAPLNADGKKAWNAYVGMSTETDDENREIEAYDRTGLCWKVDPGTGGISDPIFTR